MELDERTDLGPHEQLRGEVIAVHEPGGPFEPRVTIRMRPRGRGYSVLVQWMEDGVGRRRAHGAGGREEAHRVARRGLRGFSIGEGPVGH